MLLSCTSEIKRFNTSSLSSIISLIFSFVFAFICVWFIIISFLSWTKYEVSENVPENYPFKEFFNGIALKSSAKLYSTLFLLRRMTLVGLLIFGSSLSNICLVVPMIVCQTVYLILVVAIRPFKEVKNNVIEISNEWFYFILVSMLAYYNETSRWSQLIQSVYLGIIITNSFTIISVLICKLQICSFQNLTTVFLFKIQVYKIKFLVALLITQTRNLKQKWNKNDVAPKVCLSLIFSNILLVISDINQLLFLACTQCEQQWKRRLFKLQKVKRKSNSVKKSRARISCCIPRGKQDLWTRKWLKSKPSSSSKMFLVGWEKSKCQEWRIFKML